MRQNDNIGRKIISYLNKHDKLITVRQLSIELEEKDNYSWVLEKCKQLRDEKKIYFDRQIVVTRNNIQSYSYVVKKLDGLTNGTDI